MDLESSTRAADGKRDLNNHRRCRPNEKGHVERLLDFARRNFLVPVPQVKSLETLNRQLEKSCQSDLVRQLRGKPAPKELLLDEERPVLRPLPQQTFEASRLQQAKADSLSQVRFDRNSYSVPTSSPSASALNEVRLSRDHSRGDSR